MSESIGIIMESKLFKNSGYSNPFLLSALLGRVVMHYLAGTLPSVVGTWYSDKETAQAKRGLPHVSIDLPSRHTPSRLTVYVDRSRGWAYCMHEQEGLTTFSHINTDNDKFWTIRTNDIGA